MKGIPGTSVEGERDSSTRTGPLAILQADARSVTSKGQITALDQFIKIPSAPNPSAYTASTLLHVVRYNPQSDGEENYFLRNDAVASLHKSRVPDSHIYQCGFEQA